MIVTAVIVLALAEKFYPNKNDTNLIRTQQKIAIFVTNLVAIRNILLNLRFRHIYQTFTFYFTKKMVSIL